MEKVWSIVLSLFIYCRRGNKPFDNQFQRIRHIYILLKDGEDMACGEEREFKVFFPSRVGSFVVKIK